MTWSSAEYGDSDVVLQDGVELNMPFEAIDEQVTGIHKGKAKVKNLPFGYWAGLSPDWDEGKQAAFVGKEGFILKIDDQDEDDDKPLFMIFPGKGDNTNLRCPREAIE